MRLIKIGNKYIVANNITRIAEVETVMSNNTASFFIFLSDRDWVQIFRNTMEECLKVHQDLIAALQNDIPDLIDLTYYNTNYIK